MKTVPGLTLAPVVACRVLLALTIAVSALLIATPVEADHGGPKTCIRIVAANFGDGEMVRLRNVCSVARDIAGWTLTNEASEAYTFPTGSRIGSGKGLKVTLATEMFTDADRATLANLKGKPISDFAPWQDRWLSGAGDISECSSEGDTQTAQLLGDLPGWVFTAGDNVYVDGTAEEFATCYDPTWGRHKARTRPSIGNHEYQSGSTDGYFGYFGGAAGEPGKGWYSFDLGGWHVVMLNTVCYRVSCVPGSEQEQWLRADLAKHPADCTLAIWHYPRFASIEQKSGDDYSRPFWQALDEYGADVIVESHAHHYERLAPMTADGKLDTVRGIRSFVVGTGGAKLYALGQLHPNTEVANAETWGVLSLTLKPGGYDWRFVPVAGQTFTDSGAAACH